MSGMPERSAIIERYNQGCAAYQAAGAALKQGNLEQYEIEIRHAVLDVVGALEGAIHFYLGHECASQLSAEQLEKLPEGRFHVWLELLTTLKWPLNQTTRSRFAEHRLVRNRVEHQRTIPPNRAVATALSDVRRFIVTRLLVPEEQLRIAGQDGQVQPSAAGPAAQAGGAAPLLDEHRQLEPKSWLDKAIAEGIARLRASRGGRYDATIDSLAIEARRILTVDAVALCAEEKGPTDLLMAMSDSVEEEIYRLLQSSSTGEVGETKSARLQRLLPLLTRRASLSVEAGWLVQQEQAVAFQTSLLPAILVGAAIAAEPDHAMLLRTQIGARRDWAEAAWAAVAAGDSLEAWVQLLLSELPRPSLLERVVATCAALGAARGDSSPSDEIISAFRLCVWALVWFAPQRHDVFKKPIEHNSPWFLSIETWQRCILDLAHVSSQFSHDSRFLIDIADILHLCEPLRSVVLGLNLQSRLPEAQIRGLLTLCAPRQAAQQGQFGPVFFSSIFTSNEQALFTIDFHRIWFKKFGIPATWLLDRREAARYLAVPKENHPAGFLLNQKALLFDWARAWKQFAADAEPAEVAEVWAKVVSFLAGRDDDETVKLVKRGFKQIEERGLMEIVAKNLRDDLMANRLYRDSSSQCLSVQQLILRCAAPTPEEFAALIEKLTEAPALNWKALLDAGAPDAAIARWCVTKLAAREAAPIGFRDGPVGMVLSKGALLTQSGPWQLAFQQAEEALQWLLEHGSADALCVIADACIAANGEDPLVNPVMGKMVANLNSRLSMILWGRVLGRPAGRAALFHIVEQGKAPGMVNVLDGVFPYGMEDSVWCRAALAVSGIKSDTSASENATHTKEGSVLRPSETSKAEAERLWACFQMRVQMHPWVANPNGQPAAEMIAALVAFCGVDVSQVLTAQLRNLTSGQLDEQQALISSAWVGRSLHQLSLDHPDAAAPLLNEALHPQILRFMCQDETAPFWRAVLTHHGVSHVLAVLDPLAWRDVGLGLFDALQAIAPETLHARHLRPEMMRATLLRSVERQFLPDNRFWDAAWQTERAVAEVPELVVLSDGDWLARLIEQIESWSDDGRSRFLHHLAMYSMDPAVRKRCLDVFTARLDGA